MMSDARPENTGKERFDDIFNAFEARELERRVMREYFRGLDSDIDSEIGMLMHVDRIGKQATDKDIAATLEASDLQAAKSLYGTRVWLACIRGRDQGNHSALRAFVREVRQARRNMISIATYAVF